MELILLCASGIVGGCGLLVLRRAAGRGIAPLPPASDRGRPGAVAQHRGPAAVIADTIHGTSLHDRDVHLRLLGRSRADDDRDLIVHMALLAALAMVVTGGIATAAIGGHAAGLIAVPAGVVGALGGVVLQRRGRIEAAERQCAAVRYELSAFLDVMVMVLAADATVESAVDHAARAGQGRFFSEVCSALEVQHARGGSVVDALADVADIVDVTELRQTADAVRLAVREGAPLGRTLAARCATLRATVAAEDETEARLRTSRLTGPLVGMGLVFMAVVIYPALGVA